MDPVLDSNILLTQTESLTMTSRPKDPKYARNKNILVIGGSGSGKTRFFVKPNLHADAQLLCGHRSQRTAHSVRLAPARRPKLDENGKPCGMHGKVIYEPYRIKVLNTINFSKSPCNTTRFAYIRSREGYFEAGQCHHRQHEGRRRKILRRFLGQGGTPFILRPDRLHLVRGEPEEKELHSPCWS